MKDANFYACVQMHVFVCVYESLYRLINQQHKLAPKKKIFGSAPGLNMLVCSCVQIKFVGGNRNIKEYEIQLIEIQEMEHQLEFFYDHTHYHNIYYKLMKQLIFFFYLFIQDRILFQLNLCVYVCETSSWKLELRSLPPTSHKHLYLQNDHCI